jgi:predicted phosphodiesterase
MKIVVTTDLHANLPALEAVLAAIEQHGYDLLVHTGDAIGIGPFPAECLDLLLSTPRTLLIMGNHDAWFAYGLPEPQPAWMSDGELEHQRWTHAQLDPGLRAVVDRWPDVIAEPFGGVPMTFLHYPLEAPRSFVPIMPAPSVAKLDAAFAPYQGPLIFYGHHHPFSDVQGRARYLNPGSLGCAPAAIARYSLVEVEHGSWSVTHRQAPYDDTALYAAFEQRAVPERGFIYRAFFGDRFAA